MTPTSAGLRVFYELEALAAFGRWYLGALDTNQAGSLTAANVRTVLEGLS